MKVFKFTLLELLIVIAIVGMLISILLPSLKNARYKAGNAVCMHNLKQAGIATFLYSSQNDHYVALNQFVNTLATKNIFSEMEMKGSFNDGQSGYLEPFLGDDDSAYNCPASRHPDTYGEFFGTTRRGGYAGFAEYNHSVRRIEKLWLHSPMQDVFQGWKDYDNKPILMDSIIKNGDGGWGVETDPRNSIIHNNTGNIPILISDGRVVSFNRTKYPTYWPYFPWDIKYIMDDLLNQIN